MFLAESSLIQHFFSWKRKVAIKMVRGLVHETRDHISERNHAHNFFRLVNHMNPVTWPGRKSMDQATKSCIRLAGNWWDDASCSFGCWDDGVHEVHNGMLPEKREKLEEVNLDKADFTSNMLNILYTTWNWRKAQAWAASVWCPVCWDFQ